MKGDDNVQKCTDLQREYKKTSKNWDSSNVPNSQQLLEYRNSEWRQSEDK